MARRLHPEAVLCGFRAAIECLNMPPQASIASFREFRLPIPGKKFRRIGEMATKGPITRQSADPARKRWLIESKERTVNPCTTIGSAHSWLRSAPRHDHALAAGNHHIPASLPDQGYRPSAASGGL